MLATTIQRVELSGIVSVTAELIKFAIINETSMCIRVQLDTKENTTRLTTALYNPDIYKNPIIDYGDNWVLLELAVLRKLELTNM